jgi:hypothetical protein
MYYVRARILRQQVERVHNHRQKVDDDHRSYAENPMAHSFASQWPFG